MEKIYLHDEEIDEGLKNGTTKFDGNMMEHRGILYKVLEGYSFGIVVAKIKELD